MGDLDNTIKAYCLLKAKESELRQQIYNQQQQLKQLQDLMVPHEHEILAHCSRYSAYEFCGMDLTIDYDSFKDLKTVRCFPSRRQVLD